MNNRLFVLQTTITDTIADKHKRASSYSQALKNVPTHLTHCVGSLPAAPYRHYRLDDYRRYIADKNKKQQYKNAKGEDSVLTQTICRLVKPRRELDARHARIQPCELSVHATVASHQRAAELLPCMTHEPRLGHTVTARLRDVAHR